MAELLFPSSFQCDCGHQSHFSENAISEMKRMSMRRRQKLSDSDRENEHFIVFSCGEAAHIICPTLGKCKITD